MLGVRPNSWDHRYLAGDHFSLVKFASFGSLIRPGSPVKPNLRMTLSFGEYRAAGLVATEWVLHGTHTGPFMDDTPPTGRTSPIRGLPSPTDRPEDLKAFMDYAVSLGADKATWTRSQFVRMPDGTRDNGKRQTPYYFDPGTAVKL
jgi:hypothetical protein